MNDGRLRDQVFNASAATKVVVSTTGGKGGYGIAKENGDGSNGGNGGNGGNRARRSIGDQLQRPSRLEPRRGREPVADQEQRLREARPRP